MSKLRKIFEGEEQQEGPKKFSTDVKKHFLEIVSTYNKYQEQMDRKSDITQVAEVLGGIVEAAQTLAVNEADDWFDKHTVKRNMNELKKLGAQFDKVVAESKSLDQRLSGLYEDMGHILSRYYKIGDIEESEMKSRLGIKTSAENPQSIREANQTYPSPNAAAKKQLKGMSKINAKHFGQSIDFVYYDKNKRKWWLVGTDGDLIEIKNTYFLNQINQHIKNQGINFHENVNEVSGHSLKTADKKLVTLFVHGYWKEASNLKASYRVEQENGAWKLKGGFGTYAMWKDGKLYHGQAYGNVSQTLINFITKTAKNAGITSTYTNLQKENVNESAMSDIDVIAQEESSVSKFVKRVLKDYPQLPKRRDTIDYLTKIFKDTKSRVSNEASVNQPKNNPKVDKMIKDIVNGTGWATDDYLLNNAHSPLEQHEKFVLLVKLASLKKLADGGKLTGKEKNLEDINPRALMTPHDVVKKYSKKQKESVTEGRKRFYQQDGIGKAKYTISFHDGEQTHKDGSDFYGIQIFKNRPDLEKFRKALLAKGYKEDSGWKNESLNESFSKEEISAFKDETQKFGSLMGLGKVFDKLGYHTEFIMLDMIPPHLKIRKKKNDKQSFVIVNKKYTSDQDWTVGELAGGLSESVIIAKKKSKNTINESITQKRKEIQDLIGTFNNTAFGKFHQAKTRDDISFEFKATNFAKDGVQRELEKMYPNSKVMFIKSGDNYKVSISGGISEDLDNTTPSHQNDVEDYQKQTKQVYEGVVGKRFGNWAVTREDEHKIKLVNQDTMDELYVHKEGNKYSASYKRSGISDTSLQKVMDKVLKLK